MSVQTPHLIADEQTGYPLVVFPGLPFEVSFLPLTWVQLEYFLAETRDRRFDAAWYQGRVEDTVRTSPTAITARNVEGLFVRGLTLQEVQMIGRWWGGDRFFVPTASEWQRVSDAAAQCDPLDWRDSAVCARARTTLEKLDTVALNSDPRTLADQMLIRSDLREIVMQSAGSLTVVAITTVPRNTLDREVLKILDDSNYSRRPVAMRLFLRMSNQTG